MQGISVVSNLLKDRPLRYTSLTTRLQAPYVVWKPIRGDSAWEKWVTYLVIPRFFSETLAILFTSKVCILVVLFLTRNIGIPTWKGRWNNTIVILTLYCVDHFSSGCGEWKAFAPPLSLSLPSSPLPHSFRLSPIRLPYPPLPHKYRLSPLLDTSKRYANFKTCPTRDTQIQANPHNRWEIRRRATNFHSRHSVCDHHLPTFFEAESAHFQSANTTRVAAQIPRHNQLPTSWMAEHLPGKLRALERCGDHLEAYEITPKTGDQDV